MREGSPVRMVDFLQTKTAPVTIVLASIVVINSVHKWIVLVEGTHLMRLEHLVKCLLEVLTGCALHPSIVHIT